MHNVHRDTLYVGVTVLYKNLSVQQASITIFMSVADKNTPQFNSTRPNSILVFSERELHDIHVTFNLRISLSYHFDSNSDKN